MRALVCGGRRFADWRYLYEMLDAVNRERPITVLIEGEAGGADEMSIRWAAERNDRAGRRIVDVIGFPAGWDEPPAGVPRRALGPIRNQRMLDQGKPDLVMAFAGNDGTDDMCSRARKAGIEVRRFWPPDPQVSLELF